MSRGNQILAGVLAVQIVLAVFVLWPRAAPAAEGELLFGEIDVEQIVALTIRDQANGQLRLAKELGAWVLPDAGNYPCNEGAVPGFLVKLTSLTADRLVTETRSSHGRLKVSADDFESVVEFGLSDGTSHVLYIGTTPSYGVAHVRAEDQNQVYLVSGLSAMDATARVASWIDTQYVTLAQDEVFAVVLENGKGRVAFTKDNAGTWTMPGLGVDETLKESAVTSLVSRASSLRMLRPLGIEEQEHYGLAVPGALLTIHTRDAAGVTQKHTIAVGAKLVDENAHFCKWSGSPYYVLVAEYTAKEWVEGTRDAFLELPPTPTPAPGS
jgi:hypothetical protein